MKRSKLVFAVVIAVLVSSCIVGVGSVSGARVHVDGDAVDALQDNYGIGRHYVITPSCDIEGVHIITSSDHYEHVVYFKHAAQYGLGKLITKTCSKEHSSYVDVEAPFYTYDIAVVVCDNGEPHDSPTRVSTENPIWLSVESDIGTCGPTAKPTAEPEPEPEPEPDTTTMPIYVHVYNPRQTSVEVELYVIGVHMTTKTIERGDEIDFGEYYVPYDERSVVSALWKDLDTGDTDFADATVYGEPEYNDVNIMIPKGEEPIETLVEKEVTVEEEPEVEEEVQEEEAITIPSIDEQYVYTAEELAMKEKAMAELTNEATAAIDLVDLPEKIVVRCGEVFNPAITLGCTEEHGETSIAVVAYATIDDHSIARVGSTRVKTDRTVIRFDCEDEYGVLMPIKGMKEGTTTLTFELKDEWERLVCTDDIPVIVTSKSAKKESVVKGQATEIFQGIVPDSPSATKGIATTVITVQNADKYVKSGKYRSLNEYARDGEITDTWEDVARYNYYAGKRDFTSAQIEGSFNIMQKALNWASRAISIKTNVNTLSARYKTMSQVPFGDLMTDKDIVIGFADDIANVYVATSETDSKVMKGIATSLSLCTSEGLSAVGIISSRIDSELKQSKNHHILTGTTYYGMAQHAMAMHNIAIKEEVTEEDIKAYFRHADGFLNLDKMSWQLHARNMRTTWSNTGIFSRTTLEIGTDGLGLTTEESRLKLVEHTETVTENQVKEIDEDIQYMVGLEKEVLYQIGEAKK